MTACAVPRPAPSRGLCRRAACAVVRPVPSCGLCRRAACAVVRPVPSCGSRRLFHLLRTLKIGFATSHAGSFGERISGPRRGNETASEVVRPVHQHVWIRGHRGVGRAFSRRARDAVNDVRAPRPPRPRRRGNSPAPQSRPRRPGPCRRAAGRARPPPAGHPRPRTACEPALHGRGRAVGRLQRRDLQLPRRCGPSFRRLRPGYAWRTQCDTEVLLAAYDAWGEACCDRLDGMFAFAVWDAPAGRLVLARDRMGQKPLYFAVAPGGADGAAAGAAGAVAFASEIAGSAGGALGRSFDRPGGGGRIPAARVRGRGLRLLGGSTPSPPPRPFDSTAPAPPAPAGAPPPGATSSRTRWARSIPTSLWGKIFRARRPTSPAGLSCGR